MSIRKDTVQLSVEINGTKAGATFNELRTQARDLNRELGKLPAGTQQFVDKTAELQKVNNVLATIRKSTAGVATGFDDAGKKINPFTDLLKKGAVAAGAFFAIENLSRSGRGFLGFLTKGTVALEDMRDKTKRTFGDSIDIVEDFAKINAKSLRCDRREICIPGIHDRCCINTHRDNERRSCEDVNPGHQSRRCIVRMVEW